MSEPLLRINNATKIFGGGFLSTDKPVVALDNYSLTIEEKPATITAIAGESGSGKTTLASAILGFIGLTEGTIEFRGRSISSLRGARLLEYRRQVQAVFQDPYEVYNPFYRVKHVFYDAIRHLSLADTKAQARELIEASLEVVGMRGEDVLDKFPHQLSGGQRQRVMVARAYMTRPRLIVADEPVSAVDASLRSMILDVMIHLRDEQDISFLYITHDLSTAYQISDQIYVLYQGAIAEQGSAVDVIEQPHHPYVRLLVDSVPTPDPRVKWKELESETTDDSLRSRVDSGCRFQPRCPRRMDRCGAKKPSLYEVGKGHSAACYLYDEVSVARSS